jgi:DNA invertase Pin-like site-specific DNA recombinase
VAAGQAWPLSRPSDRDGAGVANRGVHFRSLQEHLDTATSGGKLVFHVFGALAEFERDLIRERTMAGLAAARARGRRGGRPALSAEKVRLLRTLAADRANSVAGICKTLGISRAKFYRYASPSRSPEPRGTSKGPP